ncbi:MFS transporter [Leeia oryzae]|uniref:MFS transporter n=1 Tax=Leeia oryzae TaxID=356662 RepID=UPI000376D41D|nr:MFS transporter [Leeia oryzae]
MSRVVILPLIVACALFMEHMDATVIATSLPSLARDLGEDPISLKLALTAYVVGLGVFIPVCGWVADRFGSRTVFSSAIVIFMIGSLLCAASSSLPAFVAARFLQGIGGAMMVPVGRIIIFRAVDKSDLIRAISYLTIPALMGPVIGPPLGGFITTYFHWRWIFLVNIPISLVGLYLAHRFIDNTRLPTSDPLDVKGFLLSAVGGSAFMLGMALMGSGLVAFWKAGLLLLVGVIALLGYWQHARVHPKPLIDFRFLRIPTFSVSVLGGSLFRIALGAVPFLLPLMLQEGLKFSPFVSGLITCVSAFTAIFMKGLGTRILKRFGFRRVLIWNALLAGLGVAAYGFFSAQTPLIWLVLVVALGGFFPSLQFTSLNTMVYADIEDHDAGRATSFASVVQQLSLGMGVTVAGMALHASMYVRGHHQLAQNDFLPAFLVIGLCSAASMLVSRRLPADAGHQLTRN